VLKAGRDAPPTLRNALIALASGDSVTTEIAIVPRHPRTAAGGRPVLVRDSSVVPGIDTVGQAGFATNRHPRTAVGIADRGRRLLLTVVDGRQAPYSDGMTLREMADLMRALGARDAINLDGGGSTALVYADPDSAGAFRVANRPSDPAGERAVGNALAIVRECGG
jgi:exopolysaccharide biosynthesis protein